MPLTQTQRRLDYELRTTSDVLDRYRLPGPHLTTIIRPPRPGSGPDALESRWHSRQVQLRHRGAPDAALAQMDQLVRQLPPDGGTVLVTANRDSSAFCQLRNEQDRDREAAVVGRLPRLVPVMAELARHDLTLAALADRVGADIFAVSPAGIDQVATVTGQEEFIHRAAQGGWSQHRYQTRAEQVWEANAALVADKLDKLAAELGTKHVVISGDVRACVFILAQLPEDVRWSALKAEAGGRHEPESVDRIRLAAIAAVESATTQTINEALDRLVSGLRIGGRAVRGLAGAIDYITAGTVDTLFVADRMPSHDWFDFAVQRALETGARVIVSPPDDDRVGAGGVAVILRHLVTPNSDAPSGPAK